MLVSGDLLPISSSSRSCLWGSALADGGGSSSRTSDTSTNRVRFVRFALHRRRKQDSSYSAGNGSWSRIFERDSSGGRPVNNSNSNRTGGSNINDSITRLSGGQDDPQGVQQRRVLPESPLFSSHGRSMPSLPTSVSQCNLNDDTISCSNLSTGLTGFPELPAMVKFTRRNRNRMTREISYAIASERSKVNLCEVHEALDRVGMSPLHTDDPDIPYVDNSYEVVVDIKTAL